MLKRFLAVGLTMVVGATPLRAQNVGVPASLDDGLEVAAPGMVGLRLEPLAALKQPLVDVSFPNTTSVLVLKDGRLVFERYFGIGGPDVLNDTR